MTINLPPHVRAENPTEVGRRGVSRRDGPPSDTCIRLAETDSREWRPDAGNAFDSCSIDAGHSDECVEDDTRKALPLMRPGGLVLWHDSTWRGDGYGVNRHLKDTIKTFINILHLIISDYEYGGLGVMVFPSAWGAGEDAG